MRLNKYKERDIPGFHEPNITDEIILKDDEGAVIGAYFPETTGNIKYLMDYILDNVKGTKTSNIPHVYGQRKMESIFFGGLRTDGSLGRHTATISAYHKQAENNSVLVAITLLSDLCVDFASQKSSEIAKVLERQRVQQKLLCNSNVCISDYYTSGSINFNGLLGLHYDTASLNGVFNIICYKRKGKGGNLLLPKQELCIDAKDYSIALLRVKDTLHGVTAFEGDFRDSIIYYSVNGME